MPTDFDNRRDIDLLIVNHDGPPLLFKNLRDGTFRDVAADVGPGGAVGPGDDEMTAVAVGDVNKDDFPDFFFARARGGVFALSDSRARYTLTPAPDGSQSALAAQFVDYDNDGLLDLLTWSATDRMCSATSVNDGTDVTSSATAGRRRTCGPPVARGLALADLDGDGNTDVIAASAGSLHGGATAATAGTRPCESG